MIAVRLEGGLGNQLFQYATGRALATRCGTGLLLDISRLALRERRVTPREYELGRFRIDAVLATDQQARSFRWLHRLRAASSLISEWRAFVENGPGFDARVASLPDGSYLVGYWQSHRYFSDIAVTLAKDLTPTQEMSSASRVVAQLAQDTVSVAIHVRRGDYVSLPAAARMHGALQVEHYRIAIDTVLAHVPKPRWFVFSDDIAWCRANLGLPSATTQFVDHNSGADAWQDLLLMAQCRHHVLANSSFSWWGAWLADRRYGTDRLVLAPRRWFASGPQPSLADRYPAHWRALE